MFRFFNYLTTHLYLFFGADVNNPKHSFLHSAIYNGNIGTTKYLIETKGANVNLLDRAGHSPMFYALKYSKEAVNLLKSYSVDLVNFRDPNSGDTYLHIACANRDSETLKYILDSTSSQLINVKNSYDETPLIVALRAGSVSLASYLIEEYGAKFDAISEGIDLLASEVIKGNEDVCKYLIGTLGVNVNSLDSSGEPIICHSMNNHKMTELLIKFGAMVNYIMADGKSLLHNAIIKGSEGSALSMLQFGANPNVLDLEGKSPLYYAFKNGYTKVAQNILTKNNYLVGNDVIYSDLILEMLSDNKIKSVELLLKVAPQQIHVKVGGQPAIFKAITSGQLEVAKLLKGYGAYLNPDDKTIVDAFHHAIKHNKESVVKFFLNDTRVSPNSLSSEGKTALDSAIYNDKGFFGHINYNILQSLLTSGAFANVIDNVKGTSHLQKVVEMGDAKATELLLAYGANPNTYDQLSQKTMLTYAVENGFTDVVSTLIARGANIEAIDPKSGMNPLQIAVSKDNFKLVKTLIDKGASTFVSDLVTNGSIVHIAAKHASSDVLKLLLTKCPSALLDWKDANGDIPLYIAQRYNRVDNIQTLKKAMNIDTKPMPAKSPEFVPAPAEPSKKEAEVNKDKYAPSAPPLEEEYAGVLYPDLGTDSPTPPPMDQYY